jgi:DNA-binding GntR family transcriptional regulator
MKLEVAPKDTGQADDKPEHAKDRRLHDLIREDIVEGRLKPEERLVVADLAKRYGSSSNPVREALHQLQGEGIVVISHNRGARVRAVDEDFVRNIFDIRALIEPYLARWFVDNATDQEIQTLELLQQHIEGTKNDYVSYRRVNEQFHTVIYSRHFNREAIELEIRQREVLHILSRGFTINRARWQAITREHRGILEAIKQHDADEVARITEQHVRGACEHLIEQMRMARVGRDMRISDEARAKVRSAAGHSSK